MRRFHPEILPLLLAACAFGEGQPWGLADLRLEAGLEVPPDRLVDGDLRTSSDYAVTFTRLRLSAEAVSLELAAAGARAFDPANPPPGYTSCHNGHCHATDGRLVPYEQVAAAGGGGGASLVVPLAGGAELTPGAAPAPVPLGACPDDCHLERGELGRLAVLGLALDVEGTVRDLRTGDLARLPPEGVPFAGVLRAGDVAAPLEGAVGEDGPVGVRVHATLVIPPQLLDGVPFAQLPRQAGVIALDDARPAADSLATYTRLEIELGRFDPGGTSP